tara:strand:+ start:99 stop:335 length:237 start_codon:yes stop_codon:yes gene_type:complete
METKHQNCLEATYECYTTFKTDYNLHAVHEYWVHWGILYVIPKKGDEPIEYKPIIEGEIDFKRPTEMVVIGEEDTGMR